MVGGPPLTPTLDTYGQSVWLDLSVQILLNFIQNLQMELVWKFKIKRTWALSVSLEILVENTLPCMNWWNIWKCVLCQMTNMRRKNIKWFVQFSPKKSHVNRVVLINFFFLNLGNSQVPVLNLQVCHMKPQTQYKPWYFCIEKRWHSLSLIQQSFYLYFSLYSYHK